MAEITYICMRTVLSTKPVPPGAYHNLSVLDRLMEKKHLKIVFYYPSTGEAEAAGEMTRRLRDSLSETLNDFPMVTGRLVKNEEGKWMVKCNDAGVRMVEARAEGSVEEWLRKVDGEMELKLVHWEETFHRPYFWSTFYVQVTEFEGGGLAVGLSCSRLLADPICATMFVKTWADTTSARKFLGPSLFDPHPKPINPGPHQSPSNSLIHYYKSLMEKPPPTSCSEHKTIALAFSDSGVRACMAMAQDGSSLENSPSPFAAIAGLFWARISKVRAKGKGGFVNMSIYLDTREVLNLQNNMFGNCMVYNAVEVDNQVEGNISVEVDNQVEGSISTAISTVAEAMASMKDKEGILELIEWLHNNSTNHSMINNDSDLVCINLRESTQPYSTIFERDIKPIWISYYVEPVGEGGQILILPSSGEDQLSIVVIITVDSDEAKELLDDDVIMSLRPKVLIGMNDNSGRRK